MYIDRIWPFTTFISRNKHNKNIRLRLYWLRLRVAEAEVQTSHDKDRTTFPIGRQMSGSGHKERLCDHNIWYETKKGSRRIY